MATQDIIVQAAEEALKQIEMKAPEEYAKLNADPAKKQQLKQAAEASATECVTLTAEFAGQPKDIEARLAKHLSKERIELIKGALSIPTFKMQIIKNANGTYTVKVTRGGKPFGKGIRDLTTVEETDLATYEQYASILIEAVLLVMSAVGIAPSVSESVMERTVADVVEAIESDSKLTLAIEDFISAWGAANGSPVAMAEAVFNLVKDTYSAGILWDIIKSLCSEMSWWEWLETAAKVTAMIVAALATDGAALIAEIALIVLSAVDFAIKIENAVTLKEIKKKL